MADQCGCASPLARLNLGKRPGKGRQHGFLMIVVLFLIVVLIFLGTALGYMLANSTLASGSHVGAMRALFLAESGLEAEQRRWAQNLNWYRSATDPNPLAPAAQALGGGTFTVSTNLPATLVRNAFSPVAVTFNVYTTNRFPAAGILQVEDDITGSGEFVRYTGVTATSFTGVTRAQTVGTVGSVAGAHVRSDNVYPVSQLRTVLAANCLPLASIQIDTNGKFLSAGILDIEGEEIGYAGSSTSGGLMTLTGVTRCLGLAPVALHAIGQPVTPILVGGDSADQQVEIISTGVRDSNIRYARRTIAR